MHDALKDADLFEGVSVDAILRLSRIGRWRVLATGEYLFLLGDVADCLYVVANGTVDLCFPMTLNGVVKDVPVESVTPGKALGWSALVKPYRFTLSARATEPAEVIGFARAELHHLFGTDPDLGNRLFANLAELVGVRLLAMQALWVRELQRALQTESPHGAEAP